MNVSLRAISHEHNIKISIIDLTEALQEIAAKQGTNPLGTIALGKVTLANTLLAIELKNKETTTSNLQSNDGLAKRIIAEYQDGKVRSYIAVPNFDIATIDPEKDPLTQVVGHDGALTVSQSNVYNLEPYISRVDLHDGSIDFDYMMYLKQSAQVTSYLKTVVQLNQKTLAVQKAVGILIQMFPEHTDEDIAYLDQKLGDTSYLEQILLNSTNYTALAEDIASDAVVLETREVIFKCSCSEAKSLDAIRLLGPQAISEIIAANEPIEVVCDFCKTRYLLSIDQIKSLQA